MSKELLKLDAVSIRFGGLAAVNNVSFSVYENEIVSIIGPNGAGKTTLFNIISGVYPPSEGMIFFQGKKITKRIGLLEIASMLLIGLITGVMVLILGNIQSLWEAVIVNNYVYQMAFNWKKALEDLFIFFNSGSLFFVFFISALFGSVSAAVVWKRSMISPEVSANFGIARTFQNIRLFSKLSVEENILIGMHKKFGFGSVSKKANGKLVEELLKFVGLENYRNTIADSLPYGMQRRLEIVRALATESKLMLLDEPAAGLNPKEAADLMLLIKKIRDRGITILLIEHHMKVVMGVSDRVVVLNYGNKIAEGTPREVSSNSSVIEAYLGKTAH